jgi:putative phage-type endonuclease
MSTLALMLPPPREFETRAEWIFARRSVIGASDAAGILGCGYASQSLVSIWDSKVNPDAEDQDNDDDKRMRIGQLMEASLRLMFAEFTGLPCEAPGQNALHVHPEIEWLGASLDALTEHPDFGVCPVELKNVDMRNRDEWADGTMPLKYEIQCQHQLFVTGCTHAFLFGLLGGNRPEMRIVERNQDFIDKALYPQLKTFWGYVQRKELPPIDASEATAITLGKLWKKDLGSHIALPLEAAEWDELLVAAKEAKKKAEAECKLWENKIKAAIAENTYGDLPNGRCYEWKHSERKGFTVEPTTIRTLKRK